MCTSVVKKGGRSEGTDFSSRLCVRLLDHQGATEHDKRVATNYRHVSVHVPALVHIKIGKKSSTYQSRATPQHPNAALCIGAARA